MKNLLKRYKKNIIGMFIYLIVLLIIGITLLLTLNNSILISLFGINYPFALILYFSLIYLYHSFEDTSKYKKAMFISMVIRFITIILSVGFSVLFMYLNNYMIKPTLYYIFLSPSILLVSYLLGMTLRE